MPDNRTLDEFGAEDPAPETDTAPAVEPPTEAAASGSAGGPTDVAAVDRTTAEPISGVFRYEPASAPCDDCGEAVARRWRDGDRFVCEGCKPW